MILMRCESQQCVWLWWLMCGVCCQCETNYKLGGHQHWRTLTLTLNAPQLHLAKDLKHIIQRTKTLGLPLQFSVWNIEYCDVKQIRWSDTAQLQQQIWGHSHKSFWNNFLRIPRGKSSLPNILWSVYPWDKHRIWLTYSILKPSFLPVLAPPPAVQWFSGWHCTFLCMSWANLLWSEACTVVCMSRSFSYLMFLCKWRYPNTHEIIRHTETKWSISESVGDYWTFNSAVANLWWVTCLWCGRPLIEFSIPQGIFVLSNDSRGFTARWA